MRSQTISVIVAGSGKSSDMLSPLLRSTQSCDSRGMDRLSSMAGTGSSTPAGITPEAKAGEPPSIFSFRESFDLPLADWAIETAKLHGWQDMLALAERQAERHRYLANLTPEARSELLKMERWMRWLERDRDNALRGYTQTGPGAWHWPRPLLMDKA